MGGAVTFLAGVHLPVDAIIPFYGIPPKDAADLSTIKCPVQAHFATIDDWCTKEFVGSTEATLKHGHVNYELYWYVAEQT